MSVYRSLFLAFAVGVAGCSAVEEFSGAQELRSALEAQYPQTRIWLALVNGVYHLQVTLDGRAFRSLPDTAVRPKAREVAQFALTQYPRANQLHTVTVRFADYTNLLVYRRWGFSASESFRTAELR